MASYLCLEEKKWRIDTSCWSSSPHLHLSLDVLAFLCVYVLTRRASRSCSAYYDGAFIIALTSAMNIRVVYATLTAIVPALAFRGTQTILGTAALAVTAVLILFFSMGPQRKLSDTAEWLETSSNVQPPPQLQPQMFPCRTTHTRLFPTRHSFSYSYLYVGIPVGWKGAVNTFLSADIAGSTWFSVDGSDHLERTSSPDGLLQKLHSYLVSQSIPSQKYPYAYLVTAPRFLGFSFNPVSFWYLYSERKQLAAMILEVNNTFDERRMYFLDEKVQRDDKDCTGKEVFAHTWKKDFHVSPFNERDGTYSLKANDPFGRELSGEGHVDNTITLSSSEGRPKIVARVYSAEPPILVSHLNRFQILRFVFRWWWVGFMTNVRILREARKLWVKNLPVFFRPEVTKTSVGRQASNEEDLLAEKFLTFLQYLQRHSLDGSPIRYSPAAGRARGTCITIPANPTAKGGALQPETIVDFHVLTPAFYSSFIQYPEVGEAFEDLCQCKPESRRTAVLSHPDKLQQRIKTAVSVERPLLAPEVLRACNVLQSARRSQTLYVAMLLLLGVLQLPTASWSLNSFPSSLVDLAVFDSSTKLSEESRQYSRIVISMLVARKLAFGSIVLLRFYGYVIRFTLLYLVAWKINTAVVQLHRVLAIPSHT